MKHKRTHKFPKPPQHKGMTILRAMTSLKKEAKRLEMLQEHTCFQSAEEALHSEECGSGPRETSPMNFEA